MTRTIKLSVCIAFFLFLSGCGGGSSGSGGVSVEDQGDGTALVSWHPPTENEDGSTLMDLAGYRIYYGNSPDNYDNTITINIGMSSYLVESLGASDWYFAMTAFNSLGIESVYSEEVYKAVK